MFLDLNEVVYANAYNIDNPRPGRGQRLFVVLRSGRDLTLHNENAQFVAGSLGLTF